MLVGREKAVMGEAQQVSHAMAKIAHEREEEK